MTAEDGIRSLVARRAAGEISAAEIAAHYLERIERHDGDLNTLISVCAERARAQAEAVDAGTAADGPLAGLPLIHKDIFCTEGVNTSCGSRMLDNFIAPYDATAVARLAAAVAS